MSHLGLWTLGTGQGHVPSCYTKPAKPSRFLRTSEAPAAIHTRTRLGEIIETAVR